MTDKQLEPDEEAVYGQLGAFLIGKTGLLPDLYPFIFPVSSDATNRLTRESFLRE